ncbi:unnamed protein product [Ectocarpus sp. CCAP 1310/34]|nr:unnamed protein product [Ectocarpus sp. CCAP 1310/34]
MSGRKDGGDSSSDSAAEDRNRSREELVALRTQVSSLTDQMSQLMSLVEDTMKASKKEEPAGTMKGAADRGDARESAAAESTNAEGGAPWTGSAQDGRYLDEPVRESGPSGRHSCEAGGFVSQEYRSEQVELAFHAWNFLCHALKEKDRKIMKRAETPQGALRELKTIHDPESSVQPSEDLKSLRSTKISRGENPQNALVNEMLQTAKSLAEKGITVNETFVLHLFLDALSDDYAMTKHNLRQAKELTRTGMLKEVMIDYKAIKDKLEQGKEKGAKGAEQAYFADGEGRRERYSSRSQGHGRGRGGGRGRSSSRGRGGGGCGGGGGGRGGGRGGRSGGSGGVEESKGSSSGGADGGGGGDYKFAGRCFRCGHRGHQAIGCTTNEKDFVPWFSRYEGWGHTKEKCATEEAVLAQVVEHESDVDSVEDQTFSAVAVPPERMHHAKVGGERENQERESDLDVMEARGPGQATPFVREEGRRHPATGFRGTEAAFPRRPLREGATSAEAVTAPPTAAAAAARAAAAETPAVPATRAAKSPATQVGTAVAMVIPATPKPRGVEV